MDFFEACDRADIVATIEGLVLEKLVLSNCWAVFEFEAFLLGLENAASSCIG